MRQVTSAALAAAILAITACSARDADRTGAGAKDGGVSRDAAASTTPSDGGTRLDASGASGGTGGTGGTAGAGGASPPQFDAGVGGMDAAASRCTVAIESPGASLTNLPAGLNKRAHLFARANPAAAASLPFVWHVQQLRDGVDRIEYKVTSESVDGSHVSVELPWHGQYRVSVHAGACVADDVVLTAVPAQERKLLFWLRVVPPPGDELLPAEAAVSVVEPTLKSGAPSSELPRADAALIISLGAPSRVRIQPRDAATKLPLAAYHYQVRGLKSLLQLEGYVEGGDPFFAPLSPVAADYDVVIIPASALMGAPLPPFIVSRRSFADLGLSPFELPRGVLVTGAVRVAGAALAGAHVLLAAGRLRSSLGPSDASGAFTLRTPAGALGLEVLPPKGSGLPDAYLPAAPGLVISESSDVTVEVNYHARAAARLDVRVAGPQSPRLAGARVVLVSEASDASVASIRLGAVSEFAARGRTRREETTGIDGVARFEALPAGRYRATIYPPAGAGAAIGTADVDGSAGSVNVALDQAALLVGQLRRARPDLAFEGLQVIALDTASGALERSAVGTEGQYTLAATPGRTYRLFVDRAAGRLIPRLFIQELTPSGPSTSVAPRTLSRMWLGGEVRKVAGAGPVSGAVVQVYCAEADVRGCVDPMDPKPDGTRPLDEAVTDGTGAFRVVVPDPAAEL